MIIEFSANPYTSESQLLGTSCSTSLLSERYFPNTGLCAHRAFISVEQGNARFKLNGSSPATLCGHVFVAGDHLVLDDISQMTKLKLFNEGATATSYIHVTYFMG